MRAGFWEILLIVVLVLILFGHNKIPSLMKNMANGINIFKKEMADAKDATSAVVERQAEKINAKRAAQAPKTPAKKVTAKKAPVKKRPAVKKSLKK